MLWPEGRGLGPDKKNKGFPAPPAPSKSTMCLFLPLPSPDSDGGKFLAFFVIYHLLTDPQIIKFHFTHFIYLLTVLGFHCCSGFSLPWFLCCRAPALGCTGFSSCGFQALEHRLNICGAQALLLCSVWDLPRLRIKPVSPALAADSLSPSQQRSSDNFY